MKNKHVKQFVRLAVIFILLSLLTCSSFYDSLPGGKIICRQKVSPDQASTLLYGLIKLEIPAGAVTEEVTITIEKLDDPALLKSGMKNVTGPENGYRFLPDGMHFEKPLTVSLPYQSINIHNKNEYLNLYTYFYNEKQAEWQKLERVALDRELEVIISKTDHFTDMINSTLSIPENPKPLGFNLNDIRDIAVANPGEGIQLIDEPEPSQSGAAAFKYEIEVPPGRQGLQPNLQITYNSEAGNGWLGTGWSLDAPGISVDLRWGVPHYRPDEETETYLLNGAGLYPTAQGGPLQPRSSEKIFRQRVEGSFMRIQRHGSHPVNYWWEATEKNGISHFYGGTPESGLITGAVLSSKAGIYKWGLVETRDPRGNSIYYRYDLAASGDSGSQLYLREVRWTDHIAGNGAREEGIFSMLFNRDNTRGDKIIDCRPGFKTVTADRLTGIVVREGTNRIVRSYGLLYEPGIFGISRLTDLVQYDSDGVEFNRHEFEYYDGIGTAQSFRNYSAPETIRVDNDTADFPFPFADAVDFVEKTMIGSSSTFGIGADSYVGINFFGVTKTNSIGFKVGYNKSNSTGETALIDITGDGIVDNLFLDDHFQYRPGIISGSGSLSFGSATDIGGDFPGIARDSTWSYSLGGEAYPASAYIGYTHTTTTTTGSVYMTDVNGDGLVDAVGDGVVYFNHLDENGDPVFDAQSSLTPFPITGANAPVLTPEMEEKFRQIFQRKLESSPLIDSVRVWEAPFDGTIEISGSVNLRYIARVDGEGKVYETADGVHVSIQHAEADEFLWSNRIGPDDYNIRTINLEEIDVDKGDKFYFRVHSIYDGMYDEVVWNPRVIYTSHSEYSDRNFDRYRSDANALPLYIYDAADDFTYTGRSGEIMCGVAGEYNLSGEITVTGNLSDDVFVSVYKIIPEQIGNELVNAYRKIYPPAGQNGKIEGGTTPVELANLAVNAGEGFKFEISADSPVALNRITWHPVLEYELVTEPEENPGVETQRVPAYCSFPTFKLVSDDVVYWTVDEDGDGNLQDSRVTLWPELFFKFGEDIIGTVWVTVKERGTQNIVGKLQRSINNSVGPFGLRIPLGEIELTGLNQNDSFYLEFHFDNEKLWDRCSNFVVKYRYANEPVEVELIPGTGIMQDNYHVTEDYNKYVKTGEGLMPAAYRCWSMFTYNGTVGAEDENVIVDNAVPMKLITKEDLKIDDDYLGEDIDADMDPSQMDGSSAQGTNEPNAYPLYPDPVNSIWKSEDAECWVKASVMSSSRKGDNCPQEPDFRTGGNVFAVQKMGIAEQDMLGASLGAGVNYVDGHSYSIMDFFDMNGDRFPDIVAENSIQYTLPGGGLAERTTDINGIRENSNRVLSASSSSNIPLMKPNARGNTQGTSRGGKTSQMPSLGIAASIGGSLGGSETTLNFDYKDINGDGLPDRVYRRDNNGTISLCVNLNLGYSFGPEEVWCTGEISKSTSVETGLSLSASFNIDNYSFAGGYSLSGNKSIINSTLIDMNGDGLLDYVESNPDADPPRLNVRLNTGSGMASSQAWIASLQKHVTETRSVSHGGGAYMTIAILIPIPFAPFFVIISPGASFNDSLGSHEASILDVNGDGFPDQVSSTSEDELVVAYNQGGKENLLRSISRPLGSSFELEYTPTVNSYWSPQKKWLLSGVNIQDGHLHDGVDEKYITYNYEDSYSGKFLRNDSITGQNIYEYPDDTNESNFRLLNHQIRYDRNERDSYGYTRIIEQVWHGTNGLLLKQIERNYENLEFTLESNNPNYFTRGLLRKMVVRDAEGNVLSRLTNDYAYKIIEPSSGRLLEEAGVVSPVLLRETEEDFEPGDINGILKYRDYSYDNYGNVTRYMESRNPAIITDDVFMDITYQYNTAGYIVDRPVAIRVSDRSLHTLRQRAGVYNTSGEMTQWREYDGAYWLQTNLDYDQYGNLSYILDTNTGYWKRYTYDQLTHSKVAQVSDFWGYTSGSEYDHGLGKIRLNRDINGHEMQHEYDAKGRLVKIFTPYDESMPAVQHVYYDQARSGGGREPSRRAVTYNKVHFNPDAEQSLSTVTVIDGLKRVVQTKKSGEIWDSEAEGFREGMNVSGPQVFDALGRVISQGRPVFEEGEILFYSSGVPDMYPVLTEYDIKDRKRKVTYSAGDTDEEPVVILTDYMYRNGNKVMTVTDPLQMVKTLRMDQDDNIISLEQIKDGELLISRYVYNLLHEIVEVTDWAGNVMSINYDILGRKTEVETPDTGITSYVYGSNGQLWKKVDQNMRLTGSAVYYTYDHARLLRISYPDKEPVLYTYGTADEASDSRGNRAGRLAGITNGRSTTAYTFGRLGEKTGETRYIKRFYGAEDIITIPMQYTYDYLGRMESIVYPDGEELVYAYNKGGQLNRISGTHNSRTTTYVKNIGYNAREQRIMLELANGVRTEYAYNPVRDWLTSIRTVNSEDIILQQIAYDINAVGNIMAISNAGTDKVVNQVYGYNDLYELVSASGSYQKLDSNRSVVLENRYTQDFRYDITGNLLQKTSTNEVDPGAAPLHLNYDLEYNYDPLYAHRATRIGKYNYLYDDNGNVVETNYLTDYQIPGTHAGGGELLGSNNYEDAYHGNADFCFSEIDRSDPVPIGKVKNVDSKYVWDSENRLVESWTGTEHVRYSYDPEGNRVVKYSKYGETVYANRMYQLQTTSNPMLITKHIFAGETRILTKTQDRDGERVDLYYYHGDHIGSSNIITDAAGAEYEHLEYTPYGETWIDEGREEIKRIDFLFTSREKDQETGLYYFGARYLDSRTSRWLSADPAFEKYLPAAPVNDDAREQNRNLPGEGGVFNVVNMMLYHYAGNNPVKFVDPDGRVSERITQDAPIQKGILVLGAGRNPMAGAINTDAKPPRPDVLPLVVGVDKFDYPDGSFDEVVSINPYGFSPLDENSIPEISRVLKPGGKLIIVAQSANPLIRKMAEGNPNDLSEFGFENGCTLQQREDRFDFGTPGSTDGTKTFYMGNALQFNFTKQSNQNQNSQE